MGRNEVLGKRVFGTGGRKEGVKEVGERMDGRVGECEDGWKGG